MLKADVYFGLTTRYACTAYLDMCSMPCSPRETAAILILTLTNSEITCDTYETSPSTP